MEILCYYNHQIKVMEKEKIVVIGGVLQHIAPAAAAAHEISAAAPLGRLTRLLLEKTRKKIR